MTVRKWLAVLSILLGILAIIVIADVSLHYEYQPKSVTLGKNFIESIQRLEAKLPIIPGTEKHFEWAYPDHRRTTYAIVQLHGFSATRQEISPVTELIAQKLGANLFMTRLCGHGLSMRRMEGVTPDCLLNDSEEAYAVGRELGDRVIIVGTSTGAALALAIANQEPIGVAGMVLVSPNFRPKTMMSLLLKGPLGVLLSNYVTTTHSWKAKSDLEEKYWTTSYPMIAVHEMMDMLSWIDEIDLSQIKIPAIIFYAENDEVVSTDLMKQKFADYGGPKEMVEVPHSTHIVAGAVHNPANTDFVVQKSVDFLQKNLDPSPKPTVDN